MSDLKTSATIVICFLLFVAVSLAIEVIFHRRHIQKLKKELSESLLECDRWRVRASQAYYLVDYHRKYSEIDLVEWPSFGCSWPGNERFQCHHSHEKPSSDEPNSSPIKTSKKAEHLRVIK